MVQPNIKTLLGHSPSSSAYVAADVDGNVVLINEDGTSALDSINVKWLGAMGDGITDDTIAIQNALNSGASIYFPAGRYKVTSLHALTHKHIYGDGPGESLLIQEDGETGAVLWLGNNTDNTPVSIYASQRHHVHDLALCMSTTGKWGLRCREIAYCAFHDLYIGYDPDTADSCTGTALYVDGSINCRFENVQCRPAANAPDSNSIACQVRPSAQLDGVAGSASGAGTTSTKFIACYFHHANYGLYGSSLNNVTFDQCVVETNISHGAVIADVLKAKLLDCYYENNAGYAVFVQGVDTRLHGMVEIDGGFAQRNNDAGFINTSGSSGKPFLGAQFCDRVKVHGVQVIAQNVPIIQTVQSIGGNQQIEMEANPYSFHTARQNGNTTTLNAALATTSGSPNLTLTWSTNGRNIGDVINIKGATSPINNVAPNRPHWLVFQKPDANTLVLEPLYFAGTYLANATASGLGGASIQVDYFSSGDWTNLVIPPEVLLTDCEYYKLRFSTTINDITSFSNGVDLFYEGSPTYKFETYAYIVSARLVTDQAIAAPRPGVRFYQPILSGAGFDDYTLKLVDHSGAGDVGLNILPSDDLSYYRVLPGQSLAIRMFMSGDQPEVFPRTETVEVLIAKTQYTITEEV